ncbi:MAG: hypothetical protein U1F77_00730 [Kiritimatiellia bacterium]
MSIAYAGAPVLNAFAALLVSPPRGGAAAVRWEFIAGILLAALGGALVARFAPEA